MTKRRRKHSKEFKLSLLRELEAGQSITELSREYDIHPTVISRWRSEYEKDPVHAFGGQGNVCKENARIARLERLVGRLYAENELLKKVLQSMDEKSKEEKKKAK